MKEKVFENGLATIIVLAITVIMVFIFIRVGEGYQGVATEWSKNPDYPYPREGGEGVVQEYQRQEKMRRNALIASEVGKEISREQLDPLRPVPDWEYVSGSGRL